MLRVLEPPLKIGGVGFPTLDLHFARLKSASQRER
jgi:hypothetical protein